MDNAKGNEIYLFCLPFSQSIFLSEELLRSLSCEERVKAANFLFSVDRHQYIQTRGTLRFILSRYLGLDPEEVNIQIKENGKPFHSSFGGKTIYFNVSHTQCYCALAFSSCVEVGVDIEYLKPFPSLEKIAHQFFSDEELAYIFSRNTEYQKQAFYECWTRREAFLKSIGTGIVDFEAWKKISFMKDIITRHDQETSWKIETIWIDYKACCTICYEFTKSYYEIKRNSWETLCLI